MLVSYHTNTTNVTNKNKNKKQKKKKSQIFDSVGGCRAVSIKKQKQNVANVTYKNSVRSPWAVLPRDHGRNLRQLLYLYKCELVNQPINNHTQTNQRVSQPHCRLASSGSCANRVRKTKCLKSRSRHLSIICTSIGLCTRRYDTLQVYTVAMRTRQESRNFRCVWTTRTWWYHVTGTHSIRAGKHVRQYVRTRIIWYYTLAHIVRVLASYL